MEDEQIEIPEGFEEGSYHILIYANRVVVCLKNADSTISQFTLLPTGAKELAEALMTAAVMAEEPDPEDLGSELAN